jgi:hypothetical protein
LLLLGLRWALRRVGLGWLLLLLALGWVLLGLLRAVLLGLLLLLECRRTGSRRWMRHAAVGRMGVVLSCLFLAERFLVAFACSLG